MNTPVVSVVATCWSPGCEEPITQPAGRITYWCERHDTERRERITAAMARLENDSYGIPRNHGGVGRPYTAEELAPKEQHAVEVLGEYSEWRWACTCGKGSAAPASTEGMARAASERHLRAVEKAEARA